MDQSRKHKNWRNPSNERRPQLKSSHTLYDHPYREAANGAILSPQTVHAKAEFVSPSGLYAIQIETAWLGDQWLIQPEIKNAVSWRNERLESQFLPNIMVANDFYKADRQGTYPGPAVPKIQGLYVAEIGRGMEKCWLMRHLPAPNERL